MFRRKAKDPKMTIRLDTDSLREIGNLLGQFANWHQRTFSRPDPNGSQANEDAILADIFPGNSGTYVDIGAGEPVSCSNTWQLYQRGWRGLLVEPRKDAIYELCMVRPGDMVYPVAASNVTGWAQMRLHGPVSSLQADWNIIEQSRAFCRTEATAEILDSFPAIRDSCQLCSIDVEGHERQVLEGIDWTKFAPRVFIVEYAVYGASDADCGSTDDWEPILLGNGYNRHASTPLNHIYVRD